jgi:putative cell wall-binding protein
MRPRRLTLPALVTCALLALGATTATAAPSQAPQAATAAQAVTTGRLAGANRYATSVAISKASFGAPQEYVVVASGQNFPDALGAGPFAALLRAPLLLVPTTGKLPAVVAAELERLKTKTVIVVGGAASVSDAMVAQIETHSASKMTYQVAGSNRYDTAAGLTEGFDPAVSGVPVYLASGTTFPDALGGGAAASLGGGFLLLTGSTKLPAETTAALKRVKPSEVVVLGGAGAVNDGVVSAVRTAVGPKVPVNRVGGADRFATAAKVSAHALTSATEVLVTNGLQYPDALSGSAVAPYFGGRPVLLTQKDCVPAATLAEIKRLGATKVIALGGTAMVSDAALKLKAC